MFAVCFAAPEVRPVDDVVVQQRRGVDEFHRRGQPVMSCALVAAQLRPGDRQHRPQPLTPARDQVAGERGDQRNLALHAIEDHRVHAVHARGGQRQHGAKRRLAPARAHRYSRLHSSPRAMHGARRKQGKCIRVCKNVRCRLRRTETPWLGAADAHASASCVMSDPSCPPPRRTASADPGGRPGAGRLSRQHRQHRRRADPHAGRAVPHHPGGRHVQGESAVARQRSRARAAADHPPARARRRGAARSQTSERSSSGSSSTR